MKLHFKKYGETGKTLVILHGIFGSLDNWQTAAKELSQHYQVYSLDLRNHGHSPHSNEMSIDLMVADVLAFCTAQKLANIHLIGHSMGGKVAMAFADKHSALLAQLIVVDIAPKTYKAGHHPYFKAYQEINLAAITNRKDLDLAFLAYEKNAAVRMFLMKNIVSDGDGGYALKINVQGIKNGYQEIIAGLQLETINIPTLFIRGANSNYISLEDETLIKKTFTYVQFATVAKSGHWVHAENKDGFLSALESFLN